MTDPHPAEADHTGQALGASYRLLDRIGSGAVGEVWRVESITDGSVLAAKILKPEHASDTALVERFVRERSLLVGLRHPNIVTVRDMVVEGNTLAIVMDYVPGGTMRDLLAERGSLPAAAALTLASRSSTPWPSHTPRASSTATSNPTMSCLPRVARTTPSRSPGSPTSASPR